VILHLIDGTADDVVDAYKTIRRELSEYGHGLAGKAEVVGLNKIDAMAADEVKRKSRALARAAGRGVVVLPLSGVSGEGVPAVIGALFQSIEAERTGVVSEELVGA